MQNKEKENQSHENGAIRQLLTKTTNREDGVRAHGRMEALYRLPGQPVGRILDAMN